MWNITHTFRHRGRTYTQIVVLPIIVAVNMRPTLITSGFQAEAVFADTLGTGFEHVQIDAERDTNDIYD